MKNINLQLLQQFSTDYINYCINKINKCKLQFLSILYTFNTFNNSIFKNQYKDKKKNFNTNLLT